MAKVKIEQDKYLIAEIPGLTTRENEVICYKFAGKSNETTATILGISRATAKDHVNSSYKKTGVSGSENPLALLQSKAFLHNWIRAAVFAAVTISTDLLPKPSTSSRVNSSLCRFFRGGREDFTSLAIG